MSPRQQYRSYLLRLWRARNGDKRTWRATLENVHTGEHLGFPSLAALTEYLLRLDELPGESTPENLLEGEPDQRQ